MGCSEPVPPEHEVVLESVVEGGGPLFGVRFLLGDAVLAESDASGRARLRLPAGDAVLDVTVRCPDGYRSPAAPLSVRVLPVRPLAGGRAAAGTIAICRPLLRDVAVVVSTRGVAGCPVLVDGVEMGRTDGSGFAHVLVRAHPESTMELVVRAPGASSWQGTRTLHVEDRDHVFGVEEIVPPVGRRRHSALPQRVYRVE